MKKVIRYECEWCGGLFKTPDRHHCKWDPKNMNCLSCKHRGEFVKGESPEFDPFTHGCIDDGIPNSFRCALHPECCGCGGMNDFHEAVGFNAARHCDEHSLIVGYNGKETFKKIELERESKQLDKELEKMRQEIGLDL